MTKKKWHNWNNILNQDHAVRKAPNTVLRSANDHSQDKKPMMADMKPFSGSNGTHRQMHRSHHGFSRTHIVKGFKPKDVM